MPKSAHEHAVAEAKMKNYAYLEDETGGRVWVRVAKERLHPLTIEDTAFLIAEGHITPDNETIHVEEAPGG